MLAGPARGGRRGIRRQLWVTFTPMAQTTAQKRMSIPLTAFAAGAVVALLVGVFGRVHHPTLDGTTTLGYATVLAMKTVVSTVIAVLVVVQVVTALWMYGKLGIRAPSWC